MLTKSDEAGCPMRKMLQMKEKVWRNSELASLRKKARQAWRRAIKTNQEDNCEAQKFSLAHFKKACQESKARFMA